MKKQDYIQQMEVKLAMRQIDRRQFMRGVLATGLTVTAATTLADRAAAATAQRGGSLRAGLGHGATTDTLDPGQFEAGFMIPIGIAINGYLTTMDPTSAVQPSMAESWEASPDAKVWTFKMRQGIEFHNGKTVTTDDVITSINHHRGEGTTSVAAPLLASVTDIQADGDNIVFILDNGNADFPAVLSDYHIPVQPAVDGKMDWKSGVGCGPYRLEHLEPGVSAQLKRYENHWNDLEGFVDEWEILALLDTNARMTAVLTGDVDVADKVDVKTAGRLAGAPGLTLHNIAGNQHYTFAMDTRNGPYNDNNVRQALKYGINREELVEKILFGYGSIGNDHPIGTGQRYYNTELEQKVYDPDKAKYYLKEAGLDSLDVELSASDAAFSGAIDAGLLIQNSCAGAGINVKVTREPNDGYWSDVWMKKGWVASYWGGRPIEDLMFTLAFKSGVSWNESYWGNERFDALLIEARAELDDNKRREMYWEMQDLVANDGGVAIPMFASYVFATRDGVGTPEVLGSNLDVDGQAFLSRWWATS
ncbi:Periplasmic dipeptide transport protein precursor [Roseovarius albus]|uniref:Periplasmic dipeptide transport protein n=1 Tax=Roseovarius albus TaxID=1247867 RepID=A0A1X6ZMH1_9RHOB|nr:ABC transporter substrate-binding protein [Roseovarius albus]SLN56114.1 Periplasmic dipeptide transport protein precursor [Roseovarius albus]